MNLGDSTATASRALTGAGLTKEIAKELCKTKAPEYLLLAVELANAREAEGAIKRKAGWLRKFVENDRPIPDDFLQERLRQAEDGLAAERALASLEEKAAVEAQRREAWERLDEADRQALLARAEEIAHARHPGIAPAAAEVEALAVEIMEQRGQAPDSQGELELDERGTMNDE